MQEIQGDLFTMPTLQADFEALGVKSGMTLLLHSSMKSLGGWVAGGSVAVISALEEVLTRNGTLVMPTHTPDLSDPSIWKCPPVRESWWGPIMQSMPAFDADLTPCPEMGIIPDNFRKQKGARRSQHPQVSFAAWGYHRDYIVSDHSLEHSLGEESPLARMYDLNGWVLLLGVGHDHNTSLHLAEYRANYPNKQTTVYKAPIILNDERRWVEYSDLDFDSDDFEQIGSDFENDTENARRGRIGNSTALLMPVKELVDYAVQWMEINRGAAASDCGN
ncbi:AAC(3) family N-acetyltransferase [Paenibacillus sp. UMB4589-SE434]|uniref:aminoglycoside N(3)-acetyltransferase n=1 Tax=Paenibacillus sp. UMB4589-SE434 TaxID=3046314 RepID=UPI00254A33CB|nr:AAC(3) family N-acetyltransferase [Paenibacillus sp. UMB4589-SE434]MDK8183751.1 AAC(3) family N-acetyltransferase [Paenibacillus sp. UMB4589-SE434]